MVKKEDQGKTSIYSLFERTDAIHKSKKELEKEKSGFQFDMATSVKVVL